MTTRHIRSSPSRPVHPPLVHAPIGAVLTSAFLDVVSDIGGSHHWAHELFQSGTYVLMVGTAVMFLAIAAGFRDRNRFTTRTSASRRGVDRHAVIMTTMTVLCVVDIAMRRSLYSDAASTPLLIVVLDAAAFALAFVGGELGGRLVYRAGIGVQPDPVEATEPVTPSVS